MLKLADEWDATIQVVHVSVPGMSLEELSVDELAGVLDGLERAGEKIGDFGSQQATWETELHQLRTALAERRAGQAVTIRRAKPVAGVELLPERSTEPSGSEQRHRAAVERITRWAPDAAVLTFAADDSGTITATDLPPGRLAGLLGDDWIGRRLDDVIDQARRATGRDLWLIDHTAEPDLRDQTLIFHHGPPRRGGGGGEIVRVVSVSGQPGGTDDRGTTSYVALDDYYAKFG